MKLSDRIRRWWNPGKWRDEHPEVSEGEDFFDAEQRLTERTVPENREFGGGLLWPALSLAP